MNPDRRYYDPEVQTMPRERLRQLQAERLACQLDRVWSVSVPFFRRKLEAAGLRRADLRRKIVGQERDAQSPAGPAHGLNP